MNHIVFCINETWTMPAGILIQSIMYYNPGFEVTFHIVAKAFSEKKQQELISVISGNDNIHIVFHIVDESNLKHLPIRKNDHVTIETYFRFLIPSLLPDNVHTALYLDCDMLCTGNLTPLFSIDISDYSAGMCPDTRYSDIEVFNRLDYPMEYGYYCAGTILMNLDWWRKNTTAEQCVSFLTENPEVCLWHDQDAINKVLHGSIFELDFKYNIQSSYFFAFDYLNNKYTKKYLHSFLINKSYWPAIIDSVNDARIVHFSGTVKPWHKRSTNKPFMKLWRLFLNASPWKHDNYLANSLSLKWKLKQLKKKLFDSSSYVFPDEVFECERRLLNDFQQAER